MNWIHIWPFSSHCYTQESIITHWTKKHFDILRLQNKNDCLCYILRNALTSGFSITETDSFGNNYFYSFSQLQELRMPLKERRAALNVDVLSPSIYKVVHKFQNSQAKKTLGISSFENRFNRLKGRTKCLVSTTNVVTPFCDMTWIVCVHIDIYTAIFRTWKLGNGPRSFSWLPLSSGHDNCLALSDSSTVRPLYYFRCTQKRHRK